MANSAAYSEYLTRLVTGLWDYQREYFRDSSLYLDRPFRPGNRPPVFKKEKVDFNILSQSGASEEKRHALLSLVGKKDRHRWFGSMKSSQALAQSVLGNLYAANRLDVLQELTSDDDLPLFENASLSRERLHLEYAVTWMGEPAPTSLDAFVNGDYSVAIECKLAEPEVGPCSRPRLRQPKKGSCPESEMAKNLEHYEKNYCDGSYTFQRGRQSRCSLTCRGVKYWDYVPELFPVWKNNVNHATCPLKMNYQLVRNVLAACVRKDGSLSIANGHAVLLYDARNPEFQNAGKGWTAFEETRSALQDKRLLRTCSWQSMLNHLRAHGELDWLTNLVKAKYGF